MGDTTAPAAAMDDLQTVSSVEIEDDDIGTSVLAAWLIPAGVVIGVMAFAFVGLRLLGVLPVSNTDSGEKTLAAVLALVGTMVTASVTLIAIVVKNAEDRRASREARVEVRREAHITRREALRTHQLARETEQRNRVETVIRAVALIGASNGQTATKHQISGAVLALTTLGEHGLAISLVSHLWPADLVSRRTVSRVIRAAFASNSDDNQYGVAVLLVENTDKMLGDSRQFLWPMITFEWPSKATLLCRIALAMAATQAFVAEIRLSTASVPRSGAVLFEALADPHDHVRDLAASALRPFATYCGGAEWLNTGTKIITVSEITRAVAATKVNDRSNLGKDLEREVCDLVRGSAPSQ